MRLIDVDALKADYGMKDDCADCDKELRGKSKACEFDRVYTKMDFCGWLDDAPTVDAVPVVRCKDCKYWAEDMTTNVYLDGKRYRFCRNYGFNLAENDYCSRAERRK